MNKLHYEHHKISTRHVTLCVMSNEVIDGVCVGIAICSNHDRNIRKLGNAIARGRAEKLLKAGKMSYYSEWHYLNNRIANFINSRDYTHNPTRALPPGSNQEFLLS